MKVRVSFTVEVDPEAWMANYGVERDQVRDDVRVYVENGMRDQLESVGVLVRSAK
jgi:hypothetical protein